MALLLLDVNVLVALAWPNHQFHAEATKRLAGRDRFATCAVTQLGFVRISSNPAAVGVTKTPAAAVALLQAIVADAQHVYLDSLPPVPGFKPSFALLLGHQQVTDAYLLALAIRRKATLLTFDRCLAALKPPAGALEVL